MKKKLGSTAAGIVICISVLSASEVRAQACPNNFTCSSPTTPTINVTQSGAATGVQSTNSGGGTAGYFQGNVSNAGGFVLFATNTNTTSFAATINGDSNSNNGVGVRGTGGLGVYGFGISGVSGEDLGSGNGVQGKSGCTICSGVYGNNTSTTGYGVAGRSTLGGVGVYSDNTCTGSGCSGWAGYFHGRVNVTGSFSASGVKTFRIDHPLDPENKILLHAAMESPEVLNFYSGTVKTDKDGKATIRLPTYFSALNSGEYRYQLTCIGGFASVYVSQEIGTDNVFQIAGGKDGLKVSWQVVGVRNDKHMKMEPFVAEQQKPGADRGKYLDPEAYGLANAKAEITGPSYVTPSPQQAQVPASRTRVDTALQSR